MKQLRVDFLKAGLVLLVVAAVRARRFLRTITLPLLVAAVVVGGVFASSPDMTRAFRTHLERFSADPRSMQVSGQQTRLWFYLDSVDLTLSPQGDILVVRSPRMTAASERLEEQVEIRYVPLWQIEFVSKEFPELLTIPVIKMKIPKLGKKIEVENTIYYNAGIAGGY